MSLMSSPAYAERATASPEYPIRPDHINLALLFLQSGNIFHENHRAVFEYVRAAQRLGSWRIPYGLGTHPGSSPNTSAGECAMEKLVVDDDGHSLCTHTFVTHLFLIAPRRISMD